MEIEVIATIADGIGMPFLRRQLQNFHAVQLTHNELVNLSRAIERHARMQMQQQLYDMVDRHEEEMRKLRAENKQ